MTKLFSPLLFVFLFFDVTAQSSVGTNLPELDILPSFQPLRSLADNTLQTNLEHKLLEDKKIKSLITQGRIGIGLVDLSDNQFVRFAQINGDKMMYAASLPKIAILLAAMDALECGELEDTPQIQNDLFLMINKSNNQASTRMIDRLGFDKIASVITDPRYELYDEEHGGGLWVGKRYAASGQRNPDPLQGLSHAATATQVSRFYYLMLNRKLVCEDRSAEMMEIMANPGLHHKFINTLDRIAPEAQTYRKSGSWRNYHADSVLVWDKNRKYILVALAEDAEGEQTMRDLVHDVEEVLDIAK